MSKSVEKRILPLSAFRYEFGFGFDKLYHPYVEALKIKNEKNAIDMLIEFYLKMGEFLSKINLQERLNVQGWKFDDDRVKYTLEKYCGQGHFHLQRNKDTLNKEVVKKIKHLYSIRESIEHNGFCPNKNGFDKGIKGPKLDGKYMLILAGQHRAAVLVSMGWKEIPCAFSGHSHNIPKIINIKNVKNLPLVKRKVIDKKVAFNVLSRIKKGFSKENARKLGFPFE